MITMSPAKGRALIEMLLADQRLSIEEMLRIRTLLSESPGGLAKTRPLTDPMPTVTERQSYAPIQRSKSAGF